MSSLRTELGKNIKFGYFSSSSWHFLASNGDFTFFYFFCYISLISVATRHRQIKRDYTRRVFRVSEMNWWRCWESCANSKKRIWWYLTLRPKRVCVCVFVFEWCWVAAVIELTALEQEDGNLSQVEVDKVTRLVSHIWAEVSTDDAMPCWIIFFVEFFLDVCGNVL